VYQKIVVGYDESEQAKDALALGRQLAEATGAKLIVAGVFQFDPLWTGFDLHFHDAEVEYARQVEAAAESVGAEAEAFPDSSAARGLHGLAEEIEADLVVVGSAHHGRIGQAIAGSTGVSLLNGSPCAIAIAPLGHRDSTSAGIGAILVGYDGSPESGHALTAACELAKATHAKLKLVAVAEPPAMAFGRGGTGGWRELKEAVEQYMRDRLAEGAGLVPDEIDSDTTLLSGHPADELLAAADAPGTVLLVGSRGYGPLRRVLLGSVSAALVRSAPCPLIVTPRAGSEAD
jgi:nucleotide-binding universal stress UspA family protein